MAIVVCICQGSQFVLFLKDVASYTVFLLRQNFLIPLMVTDRQLKPREGLYWQLHVIFVIYIIEEV